MAKALADGLSLEGAGEALSIGAAGLFLRSLGGNPMDVHLHTSINLRRYLLRLDGISLRNKLMLLLTWQSGPEIRSTARSHGAGPAARYGGGRRAADALAGRVARRDHAQHLQPAADRLVAGHQSRADAGGAGGQGDGEPGHAIHASPATTRRRSSRVWPRSSATTISPRCTPSSITSRSSRNTRDPRALALDAPGVRRPGGGRSRSARTWRSTRSTSNSCTPRNLRYANRRPRASRFAF